MRVRRGTRTVCTVARSRRWRLLCLVLLCSVGPTSVGAATLDDAQRDRALALIERLGGELQRDAKEPGNPVVRVRLNTTRVTDADLAELIGFPRLRELNLSQTRITDAGLAHVGALTSLRTLHLGETAITDKGLAHLINLSDLEVLTIGQNAIGDAGLAPLGRLKALRTLSLSQLDVTDEGLRHLSGLTRLEELRLNDLKITGAGLAHLGALTGLRKLRLDSCPISDDGLAHLSGLVRLEDLGLARTKITDRGLEHLAGLEKLRSLDHEATGITSAGLAKLKGLKRPSHAEKTTVEPAATASKPVQPTPTKTASVAEVNDELVRSAVVKALVPIQKSLLAYPEKRDCFSCHNQGVPIFALSLARERGFTIDADALQGAIDLTLEDLESARERYREGRGQAGGVDRAGYALWALGASGHAPDETTAAVAGFLVVRDKERDHWHGGGTRPPSEGSPFTATAMALQALRAYGIAAYTEDRAARVDRAVRWLKQAKPADTEDRVFQLWGLSYTGDAEVLQPLVKDLLAAQRDDGGWAQVDNRQSDAYATGSVLVALHQAGGLSVNDPAYKRGVAFLVQSQQPDGTWHVASRSNPFQVYFESGFPHGKDQFISMSGSSWAVAALVLTSPRSGTRD